MISRRTDNQYQVPRRFGLRTILVVTGSFAALLSAVQWTNTSLVDLILYASFVVVVAGSQIVLERSPRLASILAGACFLSILKIATLIIAGGLAEMINTGPFIGLFSEGRFIFLPLFGALLGYLAGTILAGLYLVIDTIQRVANWNQPRHAQMPTEAS